MNMRPKTLGFHIFLNGESLEKKLPVDEIEINVNGGYTHWNRWVLQDLVMTADLHPVQIIKVTSKNGIKKSPSNEGLFYLKEQLVQSNSKSIEIWVRIKSCKQSIVQ